MSDMLDDIREFQRKLDAMPPRVARFIARHDVPYGHVYHMWTTRGDLIAYINRGEVADMPRAPKPLDFIAASTLCPPGILGIPAVIE